MQTSSLGDVGPSLVRALRRTGAMPWLERRAAYTIGAPVLSLAGAATTLSVPMLLDPTSFGDYMLLLSLFQYACGLDLGLSQLCDKTLAIRGRVAVPVRDLIWSRVLVAGAAFLLAVPVCLVLAQPVGQITTLNLLITFGGGLAFMLSTGAVALYRAGSRVWEFTFAALIMQVGLSAPRFVGLILGGVTGCFAALAAWFVLTAALLSQPFLATLRAPPSLVVLGRTLCDALPLFAFGALWLLYVTANRWFAAMLSGPLEFGLFAFGANFVHVGVGLLATIAQVHYPKHLAAAGEHGAAVRLTAELRLLIGATLLGTLFGLLTCRFAIAPAFPHFAAASTSAAALMASGAPLGLAAWLLPLATATSRRPWRDAAVTFSIGVGVLGGMMFAGAAMDGIVGQAWGCAMAGMVLVGVQLRFLTREGLLRRAQAQTLFATTLGAVMLHAAAWILLFRH